MEFALNITFICIKSASVSRVPHSTHFLRAGISMMNVKYKHFHLSSSVNIQSGYLNSIALNIRILIPRNMKILSRHSFLIASYNTPTHRKISTIAWTTLFDFKILRSDLYTSLCFIFYVTKIVEYKPSWPRVQENEQTKTIFTFSMIYSYFVLQDKANSKAFRSCACILVSYMDAICVSCAGVCMQIRELQRRRRIRKAASETNDYTVIFLNQLFLFLTSRHAINIRYAR